MVLRGFVNSWEEFGLKEPCDFSFSKGNSLSGNYLIFQGMDGIVLNLSSKLLYLAVISVLCLNVAIIFIYLGTL